MVRLKDSLERGNRLGDLQFQFQYGTIKRTIILESSSTPQSFNSNMVRLKGS